MYDHPDAEQSAEDAGLRYVSDSTAGISRHRAGTGFFYRDSRGDKIDDKKTIARIKSLAIPPAWEDVWIARTANAHLQATGRDAKGRKQYRYHPKWAETRDKAKYEHMMEFGRALPNIRDRVNADLRQQELSRTKVLAAIVKLLETTLIRVGNDKYAIENSSYGLTTMRDRHAKIKGSTVTFSFTGKGDIDHDIVLQDQRLASIVLKCQELPGQELFQYLDEHEKRQSIDSSDVNDYLKDISGQDFTAKDYRTWAGTMLAAEALAGFDLDADDASAKSNIVTAIEHVSKRLGNTPAICRKCYVHPAIIDAYLEGETISTIRQRGMAQKKEDLPALEHAVLELLIRRLKKA